MLFIVCNVWVVLSFVVSCVMFLVCWLWFVPCPCVCCLLFSLVCDDRRLLFIGACCVAIVDSCLLLMLVVL